MGYSSLARVLTGWTGTITFGATASEFSLTVTPFTRESAASLLRRLVNETLLGLGRSDTLSVSAAGLVTITGDPAGDNFSLVFTGNCGTRTGFTGSYVVEASSFTAATSPTSIYVPAYGLRLADPFLATSHSAHVGDGTGGGAPVMVSGASKLMLWHSAITVPDMSYEYDVWHDGRVFGRVLAKSFVRVPMSTLRTVNTTRIDLDVCEVA